MELLSFFTCPFPHISYKVLALFALLSLTSTFTTIMDYLNTRISFSNILDIRKAVRLAVREHSRKTEHVTKVLNLPRLSTGYSV